MKKILGILIMILIFAPIAQGKEAIWCRGPLEFTINNHRIINAHFMKSAGPAGHNGGKLKPGSCAYEKSGPTGGDHFQILFKSTDFSESPEGVALMQNSYLYFLSNPGYVVFMGWAGETQFNYKSLKAVPFRKDRTQRLKKKMGTVPK
jgi:hypothetical protein